MDKQELILTLVLQQGQYLSGLAKAQKETAKATKHAQGLSSIASTGFGKLAGLVSFGAIMFKIAEETREAQKAQAQLSAVIASTGGAAGVSAKAANDLAQKLSDLTAVDDDVIVGAEAVLLRFRNMSEKVFPAATEAALDFSAATGKDLNASALAVGKALDSLGQSTTALDKAGAGLTDSEKAQAKALAATGDKAAAQKVVLDALQRSVGGSAAAQAATFGGALDRITNSLGNIAAAVGDRSTPGLIMLSEYMAKAAKDGTALKDVIEGIGDVGSFAFSALGQGVTELNKLLADAAYAYHYIKSGFDENAKAVKKAAATLAEANRMNDEALAKVGKLKIFENAKGDRITLTPDFFKNFDPAEIARIKKKGYKELTWEPPKKKTGKSPNEQEDGSGLTKPKYLDASGLMFGGAAQAADIMKKNKDDVASLSKAAQTVVQDVANLAQTWADNISGIFNVLAENQKKALDHMQNQIKLALDAAEKMELEAAGVAEKTRAQVAAKEVVDIQRQISKTTSLKKKKALQEELVEARKEKTKYEIQEKYEKQRHLLDLTMDFMRMQIERRQFERNKQYQIASIWINTAAAITAAWLAAWQMQSSGGAWAAAVALGAVSTALMLANATAQTAQVALQKAPQFEEGTWYVPNTGPAILHQGEKVVTKTLAESIDSGEAVLGSGKAGGVTIHVHGTLIDGVKAIKQAFGAAKIKLATGGVY